MRKLFSIFTALTLSAGLWAAAPANAESVDLGLPSGLKWATFNVGATTPEGYGDYFAWGETEPYYNTPITDPITWKTGKEKGYSYASYFDTNDEGDTFIKYYKGGGKTTLDPEDDAATANWGSDWRMPTKDEINELLNECDWEWTEDNNGTGVKGYIVKSKATGNNNSIFLPASGTRSGTLNPFQVGSEGDYWSSSLGEKIPGSAYTLSFIEDMITEVAEYERNKGFSVRPVTTKSIVPSALPTLKNADKAPVRKYIKNGRFEMEINGKNYNALGAEF